MCPGVNHCSLVCWGRGPVRGSAAHCAAALSHGDEAGTWQLAAGSHPSSAVYQRCELGQVS